MQENTHRCGIGKRKKETVQNINLFLDLLSILAVLHPTFPTAHLRSNGRTEGIYCLLGYEAMLYLNEHGYFGGTYISILNVKKH
jgi:hypothetical protein